MKNTEISSDARELIKQGIREADDIVLQYGSIAYLCAELCLRAIRVSRKKRAVDVVNEVGQQVLDHLAPYGVPRVPPRGTQGDYWRLLSYLLDYEDVREKIYEFAELALAWNAEATR